MMLCYRRTGTHLITLPHLTLPAHAGTRRIGLMVGIISSLGWVTSTASVMTAGSTRGHNMGPPFMHPSHDVVCFINDYEEQPPLWACQLCAIPFCWIDLGLQSETGS
eukprot:2437543-Amphidinium_carterae.4